MKLYVESVFMIKWKKVLINIGLILLLQTVSAQNIPIETWRSHFSYNSVQKIIFGNGKVIAAVPNAIFYMDLASKELNTLTKTDGLSSAGVSAIAYNEKNKCLVIGYESGLIDLHKNGKVYTIDDFYKSALLVSKKVNDIVTKDDVAYVACGLGIIEISLINNRINNNFRSIGQKGADFNILELAIYKDQLFAISDTVVQHASITSNLPDFTQWTHFTHNKKPFKSFTVYEDSLYILENSKIIRVFKNNSWESLPITNNLAFAGLVSDGASLKAYTSKKIYNISENSIELNQELEAETQTITFYDGFWLGTKKHGLITPESNIILPNGPISDDISRVRYTNQSIYACYGPYPENFKNTADSIGIDVFNNISWSTLNIPDFYNITDVAYYKNQLYLSSAGYGLYNLTAESIVDGLASSLNGKGAIIPELYSSDNLYIASYASPKPLQIMDKDGLIMSYDTGFLDSAYPVGITVSRGGTAWMQTSYLDHSGIMVVRPDDGAYKLLKTSHGLYSNTVTDIAISSNDVAWIGSLSGPSFFYDATYVIEQPEGIKPIYDNDYLLQNENIPSLITDGGNRIWISSKEGLRVFDASLNEEVYHFTTENSPLPSNDIKELTYNSKNGELYILTTKGLVSYRTNSSAGPTTHRNVNIFPNPVRPGYEGKVGISGVVSNSNIKITDVNGRLIKELDANGGSASWDLLDYDNHKVESGIYVIFSSSSDGLQTYIGKIAVIN